MTKTLAALAVIIVAIGMTVGIKMVAERNRAISTISNDQSPVFNENTAINDQNIKQEKLKLEILSPSNEVVNASVLVVYGKTEPKAEVMVDSVEIEADENGEFQTKVTLDEGENEIMVVVNNEVGDFVEKIVKVTYEPAE